MASTAGMKATTISVYGDRDYVARLGRLAALRGLKIGALVREALDAQLGEQLSKLDRVAVFFDATEYHSTHSDTAVQE